MDYNDLFYNEDANAQAEDINALLNETIHSGMTGIDESLLPTEVSHESMDTASPEADQADAAPEENAEESVTKRSKRDAAATATQPKDNAKIAKGILRSKKQRYCAGHFKFDEEPPESFSIHDFVPEYPFKELLPVPFNVICLGKVPMEAPLDLKTLYARCKCVEFGVENRPILHMTITEPRAMTAFINLNGTVRLVGATSVLMGKNAMKRVMQVIREVFREKFTEFPFACCNLMANFDYGIPIRIGEFAEKYPNACFYEPLIFAGVTVCFTDNVRALVFVTGKAIVVGARTHHELLLAFQTLTRRIAPFFKDQVQSVSTK